VPLQNIKLQNRLLAKTVAKNMLQSQAVAKEAPYLKRIIIATTNAKRAMDSVNANPIIPIGKTSSLADGLRAIAVIRFEKILPNPIPTPNSANIANPAPIIFAADISIVLLSLKLEPVLM
jgi:hypothetical protein